MTTALTQDVLSQIEALIQEHYSGIYVPELHRAISQLHSQYGIMAVGLWLNDCGTCFRTQYFGLILLKNSILSRNVRIKKSTFLKLRDKVLEKLISLPSLEMQPSFECAAKKLLEIMARLSFAATEHWKFPIRYMVSALTGGQCNERDAEFTLSSEPLQQCIGTGITDTQCAHKLLLFIITWMEEFSSCELDEKTKRTMRNFIAVDDTLVCHILQTLMNLHPSEDIAIKVVQCCQLWLSFIIGNSGAVEHLGLFELVYDTMSKSERLYLAGLDCIIHILDEEGAGLRPDNDTANMLDFHTSRMVSLLDPTLRKLIGNHAEAVRSGKSWDDFEQSEPLSQIVLLLHTLTDSQMSFLLNRAVKQPVGATDDSMPPSTIWQFLNLLPLTMSLTGCYPEQEKVSDLGLQIWSNFVESVSLLDPDLSALANDAVSRLQSEFLHYAVNKCCLPDTVDNLFSPYNRDNYTTWCRFRAQSADVFLAAYQVTGTSGWFLQLLDQLTTQFDRFTGSGGFGDNWQLDEVLLFVLNSISEEFVQETGRASCLAEMRVTPVLFSLVKLAKCALSQFWSADGSFTTVPQLSDCLVIVSSLQTCCQYLPQQVEQADLASEALDRGHTDILVDFVFTCMCQLFKLAASAPSWLGQMHAVAVSAEAAKKVIEGLPHVVLNHTDRLLFMMENSLEAYHYVRPPGNEVSGVAYCIGALSVFSATSTNECVSRILHRQLIRLREQLQIAGVPDSASGSNLQLNEKNDAIAFTPLFFTELFSGMRSVLTNLSSGDAISGITDLLVMAADALLQVVVCLQQMIKQATIPLEVKFLKEITRLLRSSLRTLIPITSGDVVQRSGEILSRSKDLLTHLVVSSSPNHLHSCLEAIFVFIETLASYDVLILNTYDYHQAGDLLNCVLQQADNVLMQVHTETIKSGDYVAAGGLPCLLSPLLLMGPQAQVLTEQIEAFAYFFTRVLEWWTKVNHNQVMTEMLCEFNPINHWPIYLSVGTVGLCLPEWQTVEHCLKLMRLVLIVDKLQCPTKFISRQNLLELHTALLLVLTNCGSADRLTSHLARVYAEISKCSAVPIDEQLNQVSTLLLNCDPPRETNENLQFMHQHVTLLERVRQAVRSVAPAQRRLFARTVLRSTAPLNTIKNAIIAFIAAAKRDGQA